MDQLPPDSQSLSQAKDQRDDGAAFIANQLSDRVNRAKLDTWQMEDPLEMGKVVSQEDVKWAPRRMKLVTFTVSWQPESPALFGR